MSSHYQEWLKHVFDHEIKYPLPQWYWDEDAPSFEASDEETTELINQTFRNAGKDLIKYTDAQVDQGIWYFVSMSCSDFLRSLNSSEVPLEKRREAIQNIFHLYSDCFAKRCAETLGHLSEEGSPLNSSCYMFWDGTYPECYPNCSERTESLNQLFSDVEGVDPSQSGSDQNGDEFGCAQCRCSVLNQSFAGAFPCGLVFEPAAASGDFR